MSRPPDLTLRPTFSEAGHYRLFIEFQTDRVLRLALLEVEVA